MNRCSKISSRWVIWFVQQLLQIRHFHLVLIQLQVEKLDENVFCSFCFTSLRLLLLKCINKIFLLPTSDSVLLIFFFWYFEIQFLLTASGIIADNEIYSGCMNINICSQASWTTVVNKQQVISSFYSLQSSRDTFFVFLANFSIFPVIFQKQFPQNKH